jgi:hypothetical protein
MGFSFDKGGIEILMNSRGAHSRYITRAQAVNLIEAACYSFCIDRSPNLFITIHCQKAGIGSSKIHNFLSRFLKLAGDWLRSRSGDPPYYVYVLENSLDAGLHVHILIHVPDAHRADYLKAQRRWIKTAGGKRRVGVLRSTPLLCYDRWTLAVFDYWPAPGFEDTEIGVLMEPEVGHGTTEVYARVQA